MLKRLASHILPEIGRLPGIRGASLGAVTAATCFLFVLSLAAAPAKAAPYLVVDEDSGSVLAQQDATEPWYPASLTKLMTAYVVLDEIRAGRLSFDSVIVVSANAARQAPSKMGFHPGTTLTIDNALKMLLVKSANDIAVAIAEGIGGSVEGFAAKMNADAQRIGMLDSHFENPNGLPNLAHHSSAQDLGILARALLTEFPDYRGYFGIGAISLGDHVYHTYNGLLGRYPGADGMKTGFICAGGFNTVVSATHGSRKLIAVVLGQPSASVRSVVTAGLLDKAFASSTWGASAKLASLTRVGGEPPDMHGEICGRRGKRRAVTWEQEVESGSAPCVTPSSGGTGNPALDTLIRVPSTSCGDTASGKSASPSSPVAFDPIPVFTGPAPGSATAIQPPATLASLRGSPAAGAKADGGSASAFAPAGGADADALPGKVKANGTPVRLHGAPVDKTAASATRRGKRGAKAAAKTPADEVKPAVKAGKGKHLVTSKQRVRSASRRKHKA